MNKKSVADMVKDEAARLSSEREDSALLRRAERTFYFIIIAAVGATAIYYLRFGWPQLTRFSGMISGADLLSTLSSKTDSWGQFGDFLGGLLNPLVGIGTIYLLLINVRLQKKELRAALTEMRNSNQSLAIQNEAIDVQNFQSTFFNWLSSYRETIRDASFNGHSGLIYGAPALRALYKGNFSGHDIESFFMVEEIESSFVAFSNYDPMLDESINQKIDGILMDRWVDFKSNYYPAESSTKSMIGLIDWILNNAPSQDVRHEYLNILASQLSLIEITFILYEVFMTKGIRLHKLNYHKFFDKITKFDDPAIYFIRLRSIAATPLTHSYNDSGSV